MKAPAAAPSVATDTTSSFSTLLCATLLKLRSMNWAGVRRAGERVRQAPRASAASRRTGSAMAMSEES